VSTMTRSPKAQARRIKQRLAMRAWHRAHPGAARENGRKGIRATERIVRERYGGDWTAWGLAMRLAQVETRRTKRSQAIGTKSRKPFEAASVAVSTEAGSASVANSPATTQHQATTRAQLPVSGHVRALEHGAGVTRQGASSGNGTEAVPAFVERGNANPETEKRRHGFSIHEQREAARAWEPGGLFARLTEEE
jgi:hypothetical protein